ncbi:MAG: DNA gyrase subunit A [Clostridia bacterium]|nr:DNA gyrase subunit A [Clostridia bacterium]
MARKTSNVQAGEEFRKHLEQSTVQKLPVVEEMKKSFIAYAMAVNVSRAIPDVRDGLKPVHRRILYAMGQDLHLTSDKPHKKCARIVGEVLGKYHPHGDSAVYDALVRLAQPFSINKPLVDGHGNFGSVDGDPAAAQRYTEARLSPIATEMLRDIEKNTVDFYPNFDDSEMQPTVLPARFPNLLVNGADGIAVGMATNIPPHNLNEVIAGTIALIDNPEMTVDDLMKYIPAPDYPTGGILMGRAAVRQAYRTGKGGVIIRSRTEIEEYNNGTRQRIVVTELPYQVNKARLIESIADMVRDKRLEGISDIREESDRSGMRLVIDVKKDFNPQVVLNALFKHTQLQISNGITLLALVDGEPKVLGLKEILSQYILHQREVVTRRVRYDLEKAEERAHILEGLVIALTNIDEVIRVIKTSRDKVEAAERLSEEFLLTDRQCTAILEMRLQRLTSLEVEKIKEELEAVHALIAEYKSILASDEKLMNIIKEDLGKVSESYGNERLTEISTDYGEIDIADLIEEHDVVVSMTHFGYIKRIPLDEYKSQKRGGKGVIAHRSKEEDFIENMFVCSTHASIMFFTNKGKVYTIKGYEIPEAERNARGRAIVNLLQLEDGESVSAVLPMPENPRGYLVMATKRGLIKKTAIEEFASIRKVGKIAISLTEDDELISVHLTSGYDEILVGSYEGKCIRFSEEDVRITGRGSQGVKCMKLSDADRLVDMIVLGNEGKVLSVTENGFGKRTAIEDYRMQTRAGKGTKAGTFNEKTGKLVGMKLVQDDNDVMVIADNGIIIRIKVTEIPVIGRDTQGVRIMKTKDGGKVMSFAITPAEAEPVEEE